MTLVLTIDDDESVLTLVEMILRRANVQAISAGNGSDGIRLAVEAQPNIILLDDTLPLMNSRAVVAALREDPATQHIPIVIFSASIDSNDPAYAQRMGGDAVLSKPFTGHDLLDTIGMLV